MVEDEIHNAIRNPGEAPELLNRLVDEFRSHRDAMHLLPVMLSEDLALVRAVTYILSEIPFEKYNDEAFFDRLWDLTSHVDSAVRLYSLMAIFPFFALKGRDARKLVEQMRDDENKGVRLCVEAMAGRLGV